MSGTKAGGLKAKLTNLERHGENFYKNIGKIGGKNGHTGGFKTNLRDKNGLTGFERARIYGRIGGMKSRRTGVKNGEGKKNVIPKD